MQKQIEQYIENIKKDYVGFGRPQTKTQQEVHENMKNEFNDSIRVEPGKKYIKITTAIGTSRSVHSFLAAKDFTTSKGVQFKKGDILKAAGYGTYTMVGAGRRGNVLEGNYSVSWTGANYLI